jgi:hypothetical protein
MKKVVFLAVLVLCAAFVFVSCADTRPVGPDIVIDADDPSVVKDGSVLAPNSVAKFVWKDEDGNPVACNYVLERDGVVVKKMNNVTEVSLELKEEGNYTAIFTSLGARGVKVIRFTVNRLYEELYNSSNGLMFVENVYDYFKEAYETSDVTTIDTFYYRLGQKVINNTNDETVNERIRLSFVDTNDDGVFDAFEEVESGAVPIPYDAYFLTPYGTAIYNEVVYTEDSIELLTFKIVGGQMDGFTFTSSYNQYLPAEMQLPMTLAEVGLNINVPYTRFMDGPQGYDYGTLIKLCERYDSDTKPEFTLIERTNGSEARAANIVVDVNAANVADFAELYDTKYMQVSVTYPASLTLDSVDFGNFFDGVNEFTSHKVLEEKNTVILYRGLVDGNDEISPVTDNFATLNFVPTGTGTATIALSNDEDYTLAYGVLFKDSDNKNVDGFVVDYSPVQLVW